jgi:hypothetical protein
LPSRRHTPAPAAFGQHALRQGPQRHSPQGLNEPHRVFPQEPAKLTTRCRQQRDQNQKACVGSSPRRTCRERPHEVRPRAGRSDSEDGSMGCGRGKDLRPESDNGDADGTTSSDSVSTEEQIISLSVGGVIVPARPEAIHANRRFPSNPCRARVRRAAPDGARARTHECLPKLRPATPSRE